MLIKVPKQFRSRLSQNGETIVEVLICLSVIGFAVSASYAISRTNTYKIMNAEERFQSIQIAQTQIERLKALLANNPTLKTGGNVPPWLLNPGADFTNIPIGNLARLPGFCIYKNLSMHRAVDSLDMYCAVNSSGVFYCDIEICTTPIQSALVANYEFRSVVLYPAEDSSSSLGATDKKDDQMYAVVSRQPAGGKTGNTKGYNRVSIPYRIHQ